MEWRQIFETLDAQFDAGSWWPGESNFEIIVGAVLVQNTTWTSVEKALDRLREAHLLNPEALAACSDEDLRELIRPAGSYTRKALTLKSITSWLQYAGPVACDMSDSELRSSLLGITGIGPETADDILLYVYRRPVFIFDAYARRMLDALDMPVHSTYEGTRKLHEDSICQADLSVDTLAQFHGLIVEAGKQARTTGWEPIFNAPVHSAKEKPV